ncbi:MAG: PIN domain-containing protein [Solirubrobacterales bacterium]|nr:PIN domain-containing protein [Solirubrobacterales bacterium]
MIRAVLDTNVLVAGFLGPDYSPAHALLEAHREGEFELVSSPRQFAELDGVLRRKAFEKQAAAGRAAEFVDRLATATLFVADPYDLPHLTANRHDDLLAAVAQIGGARFCVTAEPELVRSYVRDLTIVTAEEFLAGLDRVDQLLAAAV